VQPSGPPERPGIVHTRAFTLVELLMVLLIIGILASMLLPALAKARDKARQVRCLNSARAMGLGIELFAADNHDRLLPHGIHGPPPADALVPNDRVTFWPDLLRPYLPDVRVLDCPCHHGISDKPVVEMGLSVGALGPYACDAHPLNWLPRARITRPAETLLIGDVDFITPASAAYANADLWRPDAGTKATAFSLRTPGDPHYASVLTRLVNRHLGRSTVGFADGHAESVPASRMGFHLPLGRRGSLWDRY